MAHIERLDKLVAALRARAAKYTDKTVVSVVVGYTQSYAIYVHENLQSKHPVGQAKYLEEPFRVNRDKYIRIIVNAVLHGKTLGQALVLAGLELQRDAQLLTPVDTGALKASAFTRLEQ